MKISIRGWSLGGGGGDEGVARSQTQHPIRNRHDQKEQEAEEQGEGKQKEQIRDSPSNNARKEVLGRMFLQGDAQVEQKQCEREEELEEKREAEKERVGGDGDDDDDDDEDFEPSHEPIVIWRPTARVTLATDLPRDLLDDLLRDVRREQQETKRKRWVFSPIVRGEERSDGRARLLLSRFLVLPCSAMRCDAHLEKQSRAEKSQRTRLPPPPHLSLEARARTKQAKHH